MPKSNIITFLQELLQRLFTRSPKFFKIWTIIAGALVLVTGLPELLTAININVPDLWNAKITTAVAWASRAALFMSLLTTSSKPAGVTPTGTIIKATDTTKLPFTAAEEKKEAVKKEVDTVEINTIAVNPNKPIEENLSK